MHKERVIVLKQPLTLFLAVYLDLLASDTSALILSEIMLHSTKYFIAATPTCLCNLLQVLASLKTWYCFTDKPFCAGVCLVTIGLCTCRSTSSLLLQPARPAVSSWRLCWNMHSVTLTVSILYHCVCCLTGKCICLPIWICLPMHLSPQVARSSLMRAHGVRVFNAASVSLR